MSDYYQAHSQEYFDKTISLDPSEFLSPLVNCLKTGSTILDVGCGSGRDLAWLKNRGFRAIGFERAPDLAKLARHISGCDVFEGDFETHDFSPFSVDALLLVTALVHLPHEPFASVVLNISKALKPGGWMFLSMKEGSGVRTDSPAGTYYLWQEQELAATLSGLNYEIIQSDRRETLLNTGEVIISILACQRST